MTPWTLLDRTDVPGGGELRLLQRGAEFSIMSGRIELMNSRISSSEKALATLACDRMGARPKAHVLIGGLGMGFTLGAALAQLGPGARVTVAELVPAVVRWARGPLAGLFGDSMGDPRVEIRETDVGLLLKAQRAAYDAILLDVDNGPEGLTSAGNDALYGLAGLGAARAALRPDGVLAVWSCAVDRRFTQRLAAAGFAAKEVTVRAHEGKGARHTIWIATREDGARAAQTRRAQRGPAGAGRRPPAKPRAG